MKLSVLLGAGLLFSTVQAGIFTTQPVQSTVWNGGTTIDIKWIEDNQSPLLSSLKKVTITLMAGGNGNATQTAVPVKTITKAVKGSVGSVRFQVPKNLGPPGNIYFLKYTDGTYSAFSSRFNIKGINGTIKGLDNTTTGSPTSASPTSATSPTPNSDSNGYGSSSTNSAASPTTNTGSTASRSPTTNSSAVSVHPNSFAEIFFGMVVLTVSYIMF